jgi:RNA polymerase sigma factor (sigma-70 family)
MSAATTIRPTPADPADLLARAVHGDPAAWAAIVEAYAGLVAGAARSVGLGAADTADVAQITWLALLENADRIHNPQRLGSWLVTVAKREALRLRRQAVRHLPVSDDVFFDRAGEPAAGLEALVLRAEQYAILHRAIACLPEAGQRLVRALLTDPDASYAEVAARVGIPPGSVGPTRARCIRRLRTSLA